MLQPTSAEFHLFYKTTVTIYLFCLIYHLIITIKKITIIIIIIGQEQHCEHIPYAYFFLSFYFLTSGHFMVAERGLC